MSKELTPLEAFDTLKTWYVLKMADGNQYLLRDNEKEMLDTIEKALEEKAKQDIIINATKEVIEFNICELKTEETEEGLSFTQQIIRKQRRELTKKELEMYRAFIIEQCFPKELKDYQEIKEIARRYNWDDITGEIFNVKTDKKYRDLFNSAIVNIQEDYRKARALETIRELFDFDFALRFSNNQPMLMITNKRTNEYWEMPIPREKYDSLKKVLL